MNDAAELQAAIGSGSNVILVDIPCPQLSAENFLGINSNSPTQTLLSIDSYRQLQ